MTTKVIFFKTFINNKNYIKILFLLIFIHNYSLAQNKFYKYNLYEGGNYLFTMSQSNDLMLNSIRYFGNGLIDKTSTSKQKFIYFEGLFLFTGLLGQAVTHEEGHRSVLSELGIGSINSPFIDKNLTAKVTGVNDAILINLRNTDLPNYIRLHTAGLESDYAYLNKSDAFFNYGEEEYNVLHADYLMRKIGVQFYYLTNLLHIKLGIKEKDEVEEKRDIVGHDLYGMIRHLHRPSMEFYRYTEWNNLTNEEQSYGKRMGYLSLLNFLNPNLIRSGNFTLSKDMDIVGNFSVNYSLAPFGDFIEQNAYLKIKDIYKINTYFRQYFNKNYTFLAGGIKLHNYSFYDDNILLNSSIDLWEQPKNLEFRTNEKQFGFGVKSELAFLFSSWNDNAKSAYFNIGAAYKTDGFIPEVPSIKEDFQVFFGIVLSVTE